MIYGGASRQGNDQILPKMLRDLDAVTQRDFLTARFTFNYRSLQGIHRKRIGNDGILMSCQNTEFFLREWSDYRLCGHEVGGKSRHLLEWAGLFCPRNPWELLVSVRDNARHDIGVYIKMIKSNRRREFINITAQVDGITLRAAAKQNVEFWGSGDQNLPKALSRF